MEAIEAPILQAPVQEQLWGTFDRDREHLYNQYQDVPYVPGSGLAPDELEETVERYVTEHAGQSHVLIKAHVFEYLVTHAQVYVDPLD